MIFYLLFCSQVRLGTTCLPPQRMESLAQCEFVGRHMVSVSQSAGGDYTMSAYRCLSIRTR